MTHGKLRAQMPLIADSMHIVRYYKALGCSQVQTQPSRICSAVLPEEQLISRPGTFCAYTVFLNN